MRLTISVGKIDVSTKRTVHIQTIKHKPLGGKHIFAKPDQLRKEGFRLKQLARYFCSRSADRNVGTTSFTSLVWQRLQHQTYAQRSCVVYKPVANVYFAPADQFFL